MPWFYNLYYATGILCGSPRDANTHHHRLRS